MISSPFLDLYAAARMQSCQRLQTRVRPRSTAPWAQWLAHQLVRLARRLEGDATRNDWPAVSAVLDRGPS